MTCRSFPSPLYGYMTQLGCMGSRGVAGEERALLSWPYSLGDMGRPDACDAKVLVTCDSKERQRTAGDGGEPVDRAEDSAPQHAPDRPSATLLGENSATPLRRSSSM